MYFQLRGIIFGLHWDLICGQRLGMHHLLSGLLSFSAESRHWLVECETPPFESEASSWTLLLNMMFLLLMLFSFLYANILCMISMRQVNEARLNNLVSSGKSSIPVTRFLFCFCFSWFCFAYSCLKQLGSAQLQLMGPFPCGVAVWPQRVSEGLGARPERHVSQLRRRMGAAGLVFEWCPLSGGQSRSHEFTA